MRSQEVVGTAARSLIDEVFAGGSPTYAVLDGAANQNLLDYLYRCKPQFECLYRGELKPDMAHVAPYLAQLEQHSEFANWIFAQGWDKNWGVIAVADASLAEMRRHLRRFLTVHTEEGKPLLFRFYDPRVLRVYLPTCNSKELAEFFGPIQAFLTPGEEAANYARFEVLDGNLKSFVNAAKGQSEWANQQRA